jgi:hypothetical protein
VKGVKGVKDVRGLLDEAAWFWITVVSVVMFRM